LSINFKLSMLIPVLAVATIIAIAGGLGVAFMILNETELEETGVIILGVAIVVAVPGAAYLLDRAGSAS
tara:strand:- start:3422 stop:3628 length:207 start_codon:yes stop_codon:yes gene_type:complete